ncbi:MAG: ribbon-helix-helix domain-containing protein [Acidobacteria bacterium]|nr:ribbon-helix-helix domain-containing protein [Acidobacteriota bacterium]
MSPKYRFNVMIEPERLEALREIERRTGATPSEQIRRAIDAYLLSQTALNKKEVTQILRDRK